MTNFKRKILSIVFVILVFSVPLISLAHPGRTDSSGGHHDYKNKSGLGSYHYHHGMGPHLHPDGVCPYSGEGNNGSSSNSDIPPSPYITIESCPDTINVGDSSGIEYSVSNATSSDSTVTSSDSNIVRINSDKTLTGVNVGTAQITIESSGTTKTFSVTVKAVPVENVEISNKIEKIQLGENYKFGSTVLPENATNKNVIWSSDNTDILEVSESGDISTKTSGIVTVIAKSENGIEDQTTIEVFEVFPDTINCNDNLSLIVGDNKEFKIDILPQNSNNKNFKLSYDNKIIKIEDSYIQGVSEGKTTLHIETWNGIKKDIPIKVDIIPVENINIYDFTNHICFNLVDINEKISLDAKVYPDNATYDKLTWSSSNNDVISVKNNAFNINGVGKVTLTCTSHGNIANSISFMIIDKNLVVITFILMVETIIVVIFVIYKIRRKIKLKT